MIISPFSISCNRKLIFDSQAVEIIPREILSFGKSTALFTGGKSLKDSGKLKILTDSFSKSGIRYSHFSISGEPTPQAIDNISFELREAGIDSITAIGGGSVIDAAKAVSAMICEQGSICDFLEGIGEKKPSGKKIPLIAVPTTAGTGSEATYNAVITDRGQNGYKKSLRHPNFTPEIVIIDPELYLSCPPSVASSSGLDALSQLIEAFISNKALSFIDTLIPAAVENVFEALPVITMDKSSEDFCDKTCREAWTKMAYASYISGLSLANNGLGIMHGIAGPLGGFFNIPHGAICGSLLAPGIRATIEKLEKEEPDSPALIKLAKLGYIASKSDDILPREARYRFLQLIETMTVNFGIRKLSYYGITVDDLDKIAEASSNKNNPVSFSKEEIKNIIKSRL